MYIPIVSTLKNVSKYMKHMQNKKRATKETWKELGLNPQNYWSWTAAEHKADLELYHKKCKQYGIPEKYR